MHERRRAARGVDRQDDHLAEEAAEDGPLAGRLGPAVGRARSERRVRADRSSNRRTIPICAEQSLFGQQCG